ncbi:MAG: hypothetical protein WC783_03340 [Candidatus Paceibacterota bacterium]|jgi:hypothetical protein
MIYNTTVVAVDGTSFKSEALGGDKFEISFDTKKGDTIHIPIKNIKELETIVKGFQSIINKYKST